jgi:hypothetical protein
MFSSLNPNGAGMISSEAGLVWSGTANFVATDLFFLLIYLQSLTLLILGNSWLRLSAVSASKVGHNGSPTLSVSCAVGTLCQAVSSPSFDVILLYVKLSLSLLLPSPLV